MNHLLSWKNLLLGSLIILILMAAIEWGKTFVRLDATATPIAEPAILSIPARDLLAPQAALPPMWSIDACEPDCDRIEGFGFAERSFSHIPIPGTVNHEVYRFGSAQKAHEYLIHLHDVYALQERSELLYHSRYVPDEVSICGIAKFALCRVVTRYRNFVSEFYIEIDEGDGMGITFDQADEMLEKIDEHIGTSLQLIPHQ